MSKQAFPSIRCLLLCAVALVAPTPLLPAVAADPAVMVDDCLQSSFQAPRTRPKQRVIDCSSALQSHLSAAGQQCLDGGVPNRLSQGLGRIP